MVEREIIDNEILLKLKNEFKFIKEKSEYMEKRRALEARFILFFMIDLNDFQNIIQTNNENEIEELGELIISLKKKFSTKGDFYGINFSEADEGLKSALIENYDSNTSKLKEIENNKPLPVFALAHPHIAEIEILRKELSSSPSLLYKAVETTYNFYLNNFEKEKTETLERARKIVNSFPVVIFIKGTPKNPFCKFSKGFMEIIKKYFSDYRSFDIFTDEKIRGYMKFYDGFKTFPRLYINGKIIGGWDDLKLLEEKNELLKLIPYECTFDYSFENLNKFLSLHKIVVFNKGKITLNDLQGKTNLKVLESGNGESYNLEKDLIIFDLNEKDDYSFILKQKFNVNDSDLPFCFIDQKLQLKSKKIIF